MQTLARGSYTDAQITALLTTSAALEVTPGIERLNPDLTVAEDMTVDLVSGSVDRVMSAPIHGSCSIVTSRTLNWGGDLFRLFQTLRAGSVSARFNCGVFVPVKPDTTLGEYATDAFGRARIDPVTGAPQPIYTVAGFDRLYLLARLVGDTYFVASGSSYLTAITAVITAAGYSGVLLDGTAQAAVTPYDLIYPLFPFPNTPSWAPKPSSGNSWTWLDIVNDLLKAIAYRPLWADENGIFRSEPDVNPTNRPVEFTFTIDPTESIVAPQRKFTENTFAVPNRWIFSVANTAGGAGVPVEGFGIYTVNNVSNGITSQNARGAIWPAMISLQAADQATLVAQGDARVAADLRISAALAVQVSPFPAAGHLDVFSYVDSDLGSAPRKVITDHWTLDLQGADMTMDWAVIS